MILKHLTPSERVSLLGGQLAGIFHEFNERVNRSADEVDWRDISLKLNRLIDLIEEIYSEENIQ